MLINLNHTAGDLALSADVCIIGAGAAGITLARSLLASGHSVCVLEGGDRDFHPDNQQLFSGDNIGMPYYDLDQSRLRLFGGTTQIWGGRSALLDNIDFHARSWVPHSGWPISRSELMPYYHRAHELLCLGEFDYHDDAIIDDIFNAWSNEERRLDAKALQIRLWRFDRRHEPFGWERCQDVIQSPRCQVVINANVSRLALNKDGNAITAVEARTLSNRRVRIQARTTVLACGGIENARLLLDSDDSTPGGIGNQHDQVGRYFMEHPHGRVGRVHASRTVRHRLWHSQRKRFPAGSVPLAPVFVLSPAQQQQYGALNGAVTLKLQRPIQQGIPIDKQLYRYLKHQLQPSRRGRQAHHIYRALRDWLQRVARDMIYRAQSALTETELSVIIRAEQAPNPNSRIVLSDKRDALGARQANLNWQLSSLDKRSARAMAAVMDAELRRLGLGHVQAEEWLETDSLAWPVDPSVSNHPIGGYHHMGATRMSSNPRTGVVNEQCRVHSCDNLYLLGSSVFPTAGWANPTLTILALSYRLADHLAAQLSHVATRAAKIPA